MTGPYADSAWLYRAAGWEGVLPLPEAAKWPPPRGFTGWAGVDPSGADVAEWIHGPERMGNICLRLPIGVYGLDVDAYGSKRGGEALAAAELRLGALPPTWTVTSREDGVSGIRLFRALAPPGHRWRDEPAGHGVGIEAIHYGHRYAVAWPSVHPETGRKYVWLRPDGTPADDDELPAPGLLPELPAAWVEALSEAGEVSTAEAASHVQTLATVSGWRVGEPCPPVTAALTRGTDRLREAADGAALHPAGRDATKELVSLGHEGHAGARQALAQHHGAFVEIRMGRGESQAAAEGEWWRMVRGAVGKLEGGQVVECDCALLSGVGVSFDPDDLAPDRMRADPFVAAELPAESVTPPVIDLAEALLAEMLTPEQVASLPNPVPVVAGLLYLDTLSWLIGKSGSFKSFIALDLAAHVAGGLTWAGRRTIEGPVVYLAAEGGGGMSLRVRAWNSVRGTMTGPLRFLRRPVQVRSAGWQALVEAVRRLQPVLVVIDTQARVTVGIRENDNTEMGEFIDRADQLRRAAGSCVLLVHHIGRTGEDARGASAIDGAQDTELKVERVGGAKSLRARLVVDKQKDGPDTEQVEFALQSVDLGMDPATGLPVTSLAAVASEFLDPFPVESWREGLNENQGLILGIMHGQFSEHGGTRAEVAAVLRERGQRGEAKYRRSTFYDAWNALLKKDLIARIDGTQRFVVVDGNDH